METVKDLNAEVIAVYPDKVKVSVDDLEDFKKADETLRVGSYIKVLDNENAILICIIENFSIEVSDLGERKHIIEANPLGLIRNGEFIRGGDSLAIPPKTVEPATDEEIKAIYSNPAGNAENFTFASLSMNNGIRMPVNGNKFFNKHIAVVGSTGSGKSHTVSTILQNAVKEKDESFQMNNSHIILFDIHSEYKSAFPDASHFDINSLTLPYWLLNSEELEELFLDTEANDHNQRNLFREAIVKNRKLNSDGNDVEKEKIHFDTPVFFELSEVFRYLKYRNSEKRNKDYEIKWKGEDGNLFLYNDETSYRLFREKGLTPEGTAAAGVTGKLVNFLNRLENKINDKRYEFLLGERSKTISFEETLKNLLGYNEGNESNVTVIDLSGVPFEVLSITVSLISRIVFEYGYFYKKMRTENDPNEKVNNDAPILLVYEEAHKYVPDSDLSKFRSSKHSIERIAKEGRKYGVSLLLSSQRPSELSETIFSQCNNFIAMRMTNPYDQNYVKKLLPDTLGNLIDKMPSLKAGEALLIGDSVVLPSIVQVDKCDSPPSSSDIPYWDLWREEWKELDITCIKNEWYK